MKSHFCVLFPSNSINYDICGEMFLFTSTFPWYRCKILKSGRLFRSAFWYKHNFIFFQIINKILKTNYILESWFLQLTASDWAWPHKSYSNSLCRQNACLFRYQATCTCSRSGSTSVFAVVRDDRVSLDSICYWSIVA